MGELLHSSLFRSFILKPNLNDSHAQPRLLGQLLPDVSGRLGRLTEGRLEDFQLLGLNCRPGASSFTTCLIRAGVLLLQLVRLCRGVSWLLLVLLVLSLGLGLDLGEDAAVQETVVVVVVVVAARGRREGGRRR